MHIVIAGNIGSGKTTLTNLLSNHYGWEAKYEAIVDNPYIANYYTDMKRWAFNLEVYFLKERFKDVLKIGQTDNVIVQDRSIYEGVYVFAANNRELGNLTELDFNTYMELFENMMSMVHYPDLMIYLRSSMERLTNNIQLRGREYEQAIPYDYLSTLNTMYEKFIFENYPGKVLVVDADNYDFVENTNDFEWLTSRINSELKTI